MTVTPTSPLQVTIYPSSSDATPAASSNQPQFFSSDGPSFKDVLDTINPLQHIPLISSIYQSLTGDVQSVSSKLAGGALFGGPIGFVASLIDTIVQSGTGADIGGNILAAVQGKPVPAMNTGTTNTDASGQPTYLSANQRASYNAYVRTSQLTA